MILSSNNQFMTNCIFTRLGYTNLTPLNAEKNLRSVLILTLVLQLHLNVFNRAKNGDLSVLLGNTKKYHKE
jgi:hypothetical protein